MVSLEVYREDILRIYRGGKNSTPALRGDVQPREVLEDFSGELKLGDCTVKEENGLLRVFCQGKEVFRELAVVAKRGLTVWEIALWDGDRVYGFGERGGPLNKRGWRKLKLANSDPQVMFFDPDHDPLYMSIPFFIVAAPGRIPCGIFLHNPAYAEVDPGVSRPDRLSITLRGNLDYFLMVSKDLKGILEAYTWLTGRPYLPPIWSLGYHQCHWSYPTAKEVLKVARKFRETGIPCDVLYIDIDHMERFKVFTWDRRRFPNPKGLIEELHKMGFKVVIIEDPYVKVEKGYWLHDEGAERGYFVRDEKGRYVEVIGWPGRSYMPDFFLEEVRRWWGSQYVRFAKEYPVDGFWNDMNEPSVASSVGRGALKRMRFAGRWTVEEVGNLYALYENLATYEALRKAFPDKRFFFLTRSGFSGVQRYFAKWTGDNWTSWKHLKRSISMLLGLSLSGVPFVGAEIGGFSPPLIKAPFKMFFRWLELGVFYPYMRGNYMKLRFRQEPWAYGRRGVELARKIIGLRYRLIPYYYSLFWEAHRKGTPAIRPLFMEFPDDDTSYDVDDELMLGPWMLAAPIYWVRNRRRVYLPPGRWLDFWTLRPFEGGWHAVEKPLGEPPIFLREGAIVPMAPEPQQWVWEKRLDRLVIVAFPSDRRSEQVIFEDDGVSWNFERGVYDETVVAVEGGRVEIRVLRREYGGVGELAFRLVGVDREPKAVLADGKKVPFTYRPSTGEVLFTLPKSDASVELV